MFHISWSIGGFLSLWYIVCFMQADDALSRFPLALYWITLIPPPPPYSSRYFNPLLRQSQQKWSAFLICWNVSEASMANSVYPDQTVSEASMANSVDPDQTAPNGAVCSGSTL